MHTAQNADLAYGTGRYGARDTVTDPTTGGTSAHHALRKQTRVQHEATEAAFARYDLSCPDHYRVFLTAHAAALPRFELGATGLGWNGWQPRYPHLADDLAAISAPLPPPMLAPSISPVAAWGVQYVLEGSRLGGRLLAERVYPGAPTRYLGATPDMPVRWQAFRAAFEQAAAESDAGWFEEVVDAAKETFSAFRRSAEGMALDII